MQRCIICFVLALMVWSQGGCTDDLGDLPVSEVLTLEWGDKQFTVSESILEIPLKKTKITKKKKKYELKVTSKNGDMRAWVIAADVSVKLKIKDGEVTGLKKKGSKCYFRHLSGGVPARVKFKLIRKESKITGKVGETIAFKLLCRKPKEHDKEGKVYGEGIPSEVWLTGSINPRWP